ncbi:cobyrinic acid a,c-diamide synthase [Anaerosporomusa subterranea]|uniref:Cobyrinate a,c-diamide synthase n=1 Tax=Anaerosporomusa subterranea TaxID=1794912 RepID=A0A154BT73_ANASB|nr:cobyrinate a,c-diamide synthase [Anaerosporomusa subterranea]KYZ76718.1 cobyrinic acid a,c-diamide synthase [Anaerosporomusa subterranea]
MADLQIPRLVIAANHSGAGKTTIVTGLLAALAGRGLKVQSYKVGPDYIDPGYHQLASGKPAHNLDTWLLPAEEMVSIFSETAAGNDIVIIEGVMGLHDGGRSGISSTAAIAKLLNAPVVLVVDARSMGESAAATALGYKLYDPEVNFAGVIINRIGSESHQTMISEALDRLKIPVLGSIKRNADLTMPERHLGLTPVTEHDIGQTLQTLSAQISKQVAVDQILELAKQAPPLQRVNKQKKTVASVVRIGVAQDDVFSFYYPQSQDALAAQGAEIVPFSPLRDASLPDVDGLILGGGFPEMFVDQLTANQSMRQAIYQAGRQGMPIYAECGGLMYLSHSINDFAGRSHAMVGLVPATCAMQNKLETVGYVEATALCDNVLCQAGDVIRGHEFHFSRMLLDHEVGDFPWAFQFKKIRTGAAYPGGFMTDNILASYLHLHFAGNQQAARRFVEKCKQFKEDHSKKNR